MKVVFSQILLSATIAMSFASPISPNPNTDDFEPISQMKQSQLSKDLADYCDGPMTVKRICSGLVHDVAPAVVNLGVSVLATSCTLMFVGKDPIARGITFASGVHAPIVGAVSGIFKSLRRCTGGKQVGFERLLKTLRGEFQRHRNGIPIDVARAVDQIDLEIKTMIEEERYNEAIILLQRRETVLLALPTMKKNIAHYGPEGNVTLKQDVDFIVRNFLDSYPEKNRRSLTSLIQRMRDNSIPTNETYIKATQRALAYLSGPPGTGKTLFVRRLAKKLKLPLCEISFDDPRAATLLGKGRLASADATNEEVVGEIAMCFVRTGVMNPIILFKHGGDYLNEFKNKISRTFRLLLDPDTLEIKIADSFYLDISKSSIFVTGSTQLSDPYLYNKVPAIAFDQLGKRQKESAAKKMVQTSRRELEAIYANGEIDLTEDIISKTKELVPFILEIDRALSIPGARVLRDVIHDLVLEIRRLIEFDQPFDHLLLKHFIRTRFLARYTVVRPSYEESVGESSPPRRKGPLGKVRDFIGGLFTGRWGIVS